MIEEMVRGSACIILEMTSLSDGSVWAEVMMTRWAPAVSPARRVSRVTVRRQETQPGVYWLLRC